MNDLDKEIDEILTAFYKKTLRVDGNTPEARAEAKAKIQALIVQAREEQIMQDFLGCLLDLDTPEEQLIEWRNNRIAQLQEEDK